jgi:hypothetical protein
MNPAERLPPSAAKCPAGAFVAAIPMELLLKTGSRT